MPKIPATASANALSPNLVALKPRQVLLSKLDMARKESGDKDGKIPSLKPDQKVLLRRLIGQYLDQSGFSKTLKKFVSEAEIEKTDLGRKTFNLEEIFCKYLENGNHDPKDLSKDEIEEIHGKSKKEVGDESLTDEVASRKKKKKKQETDVTDGHAVTNAEASKETTDKIVTDEHEKKHKDKKKSKSDSKYLDDDVLTNRNTNDLSSEIKPDSETEDKRKDKKKKKKKDNEENKQDPDTAKVEEANGVTENKSDRPKRKKRKFDNKASDEHEAEKVSKKRKKLEAEENNEQPVDHKDNEENNADVNGFQKMPEKQPDGKENGNAEKSGSKSATGKSAMKLQNGSKEPKKPFQRVNVEQVVFTDERLQDNSYWAKDGADSGYGAKAQEVLGQVRGRDFRHEKTKKKRGSYRGGQIDLQSHSIKFNYSEEE